MRLISIILIIIAFSSCINGVFVFDRSLLRNLNRTKIQKDPVGSAIYASFTYGGICPSGSAGPLPGISIHAATGTQSTCFTDDSIAAEDVSIGYVCFPGSPATVYISYPGTNGLIIGGPSFIATGDQNYGYAWGRIGAPTFGAPVSTSCTASCVATCSASYCNPSCEARCDSNPSCIGTDNSVTCTNNQGVATGGTLYFIPTGSTPDNCGTSGGHCCSTFTYPAPVEYRYWKLTATDLGASPGDPYWQISEFNFLKLGNRIPSVSQTSVGNDPQGDFPNSGSPGGEDATKIDDDNKDTKFLAAKKSGVVFDFGSAKSFDQYQWYTANDASWRDMTGWTLEASNDNSAWTLIDTKTSQTITTDRKSLVGPFSIVLPTL